MAADGEVVLGSEGGDLDGIEQEKEGEEESSQQGSEANAEIVGQDANLVEQPVEGNEDGSEITFQSLVTPPAATN